MAFIPFEDGALAVIEVGTDTVNWTNTLWFEDLITAGKDFQGLANYLHTWYGENIMPELCDFWYLRKVTVYDMSSPLGSIYYDEEDPEQGGKIGNATPINSALVVTFYTPYRGRWSRGRNYIAGFEEDDVAALSVSDSVVVANIQQAYTTLITEVQTEVEWAWVVASKYFEGAPREAVVPLQINGAQVRNAILGSQRRRIDRE